MQVFLPASEPGTVGKGLGERAVNWGRQSFIGGGR